MERTTVGNHERRICKTSVTTRKSKSALCKEYGISRPTGDKWIERYLANESLSDQSRAPKFTPHKTKP
ncbi:MAG: helix-turn-helix domain-containing protein, partial [Clostridia bacterium]|nr:helix-turn-helix domain-containing protein [Clostridia bacterium]